MFLAFSCGGKMKLLWIRANALDLLRGGGHLRSYNMLKLLKLTHEVDFLCFEYMPGVPQTTLEPTEYCSRFYTIPFPCNMEQSKFPNDLPRSVAIHESAQMKRLAERLLQARRYDFVVADFPLVARNIPESARCILFEHNVEATMIERHLAFEKDAKTRSVLQSEAAKMRRFEMATCCLASGVWTVSDNEAEFLRGLSGVSHVYPIGTGVDMDYFTPPVGDIAFKSDLVFAGRMDWWPNVDAVIWFVSTALQQIRKKHPGCSLTIVGRDPHPAVCRLARQDKRIFVTGTVPDVRPYLWGAGVSVIPLRIGAGTRIKMYEAMAAGTPVVSTRLGAEGLLGRHGLHCFLADDPIEFAGHCLELLHDDELRNKVSRAALDLIASEGQWSHVVQRCEASFREAKLHKQ